MVKLGVIIFQCLWLMLYCSSHAVAAVNASIDRNAIHINESLQLIIEVTEGEEGEPDTAVLEKDFEILSRSHNSSVSFINGSMSKKSVWNLMLMPRAVGTFTIPSFKMGNSISRAIIVKVGKQATNKANGHGVQEDVWIEMEASPKASYVQQQLILVIRVNQRVTLNQAKMNEPEPANTMIERLGEDKTYQTTVSGRTWYVTERRYALFPQKSGTLHIDPVQLDGTMLSRNNRSFFQNSRPIRVRSNALTLQISAVPTGGAGHEWLPAKNIRIIEDWPTTAYRVGEPITRTLTLKANGLVSSQLPQFDTLLPDGLKGYPDQPLLNDIKQADGIRSSREEKVAIVPTQPGTFVLPSIEIGWWNTSNNQYEVASLPPRTFQVIAAAKDHSPTSSPQTNEMIAANTQTNTAHEKNVAQDWRWLAIFSSAGWFITLLWFWFRRPQASKSQSENGSGSSQQLRKLKRAVLMACKNSSDPRQAKKCEQALLSFAQYQWPEHAIQSLTRLAELCDGALAEQIVLLEQGLYGNNATSWSAQGLAAVFSETTWIEGYQSRKTPAALPPLYPGGN
ncbi:MAG: BatD family protein [Mariprofundaceae bacterium]